MKASDLKIPFLTKFEKENEQAYNIYKKYKNFLQNAEKYKEEYLFYKQKLKEKHTKDLERYVELVKKFAIENWEKSQKYLEEYNEFQKNRKYK